MISVGLREARLLSQPVVDGDGLVQPHLLRQKDECLLKLGQHPGKNVQLFFSKLHFLHGEKGRKKTYNYHNALWWSGRNSSTNYVKFVFFVISLR